MVHLFMFIPAPYRGGFCGLVVIDYAGYYHVDNKVHLFMFIPTP